MAVVIINTLTKVSGTSGKWNSDVIPAAITYDTMAYTSKQPFKWSSGSPECRFSLANMRPVERIAMRSPNINNRIII